MQETALYRRSLFFITYNNHLSKEKQNELRGACKSVSDFLIDSDDDELEKLAEEEDFDIFGLVISAEDLAMLLSDIEDDEFDGVVINPFHENAVELPLEAICELYDFEECDDPDCDDPSHNH